MKVIAFVPIKFKSQRLKNKMLLPLGDYVLCQHIFFTLLKVKQKVNIDIYCFCSDEEIKKYLPDGIMFLKRDKCLDCNETKGIDIYNSFCKKIKGDIYGLFHATSPFINESSIIEGFNKVIYNDYDSSFSCSQIKTFCWYNNTTLNYELTNVVRTQDITPIYWETSAFYIFKSNVIENNRRIGENPFMVITNKYESVDIDEQDDYDLARALLNKP